MDTISSEENIIYEDEDAVVVLSLDPITKGHAVIKPKMKFKDLDEVPESILNKILTLTQCYVRLLKMKYEARGYSIMQNGGEFNDICQFHLHVFARNLNEDFSWTFSDNIEEGAMDFKKVKADLEDEFTILYKG